MGANGYRRRERRALDDMCVSRSNAAGRPRRTRKDFVRPNDESDDSCEEIQAEPKPEDRFALPAKPPVPLYGSSASVLQPLPVPPHVPHVLPLPQPDNENFGPRSRGEGSPSRRAAMRRKSRNVERKGCLISGVCRRRRGESRRKPGSPASPHRGLRGSSRGQAE